MSDGFRSDEHRADFREFLRTGGQDSQANARLLLHYPEHPVITANTDRLQSLAQTGEPSP